MKTVTHKVLSLALALAALALNLSVIYDAQAASWVTNSPMTTTRQYQTATLLPNGRLLVVGGVNGSLSFQYGVVRSSHGEMYDDRRAECRARISHSHSVTQWQGAGRGGQKLQAQAFIFQCGSLRSNRRDLDDDWLVGHFTRTSHGHLVA